MQGLTQVEEMLISAVIPLMSVYRLPHGQYGYKGDIINLPQDIKSFCTSLPRLPKNVDILIVRKEGGVNAHKDFKVRRAVVHRALHWLKQNNRYYPHIDIDYDCLNQLPEDENLSGLSEMEAKVEQHEKKI